MSNPERRLVNPAVAQSAAVAKQLPEGIVRDAWNAIIVTKGPRKGCVRKQAPSFRKEPLAWAAWQGFWTARGHCGEGTIAGLIMSNDNDVRMVWDMVSDVVMRAMREHSERTTR